MLDLASKGREREEEKEREGGEGNEGSLRERGEEGESRTKWASRERETAQTGIRRPSCGFPHSSGALNLRRRLPRKKKALSLRDGWRGSVPLPPPSAADAIFAATAVLRHLRYGPRVCTFPQTFYAQIRVHIPLNITWPHIVDTHGISCYT